MSQNRMPPAPDDEEQRQQAQWQRNKPSLIADLSLGALFFVVAKLTDLTTAALVGAAAGLALVVIQRFVKVDLLGGLALFGVVMLLVSAGFSLAFEDDWAVKMKSTAIGLLVAALFLFDGLRQGRYLGRRLARYVPYPDVDPGRLAIGMGMMGLVMALLNYAVARSFSTDIWLYYSTFGDTVLAMVLVLAAMRYARTGRVPVAAPVNSR
jgi:intracellular septation protein A